MKKLIFLALIVIGFISCDKEDEENSTKDLYLNIKGLQDLGSDYVYEGWIIVNNAAKTTGRFVVDDKGKLNTSTFTLDKNDLEIATSFILTIEPATGDDPAPSKVHILAGEFSGNAGNLTISHKKALGNDFSTAAGKYILGTPTDGSMNNEKSGIWFVSLESAPTSPGLTLPALPDGWIYEGWVVINGIPVTTGTFSKSTGADSFSGFSGVLNNGPAFPGEDFIMNAPTGLTFPTNIQGGKVVISIEPVPDNNAAPFLLKPLVGDIPMDALDHTTYAISKNLNFPTGTFTR